MLNHDFNDDQPTPSALRAMHTRFIAWLFVGIAFGFVLAILSGLASPAKAKKPATSSWATTVTPNAAVREKSGHKMLMDIIKARREHTRKLERFLADQEARKALNSLLYNLDAAERHSRGVVNPDEL